MPHDAAPARPIPPRPERRPTVRELHGDAVSDPYAWLRSDVDHDAPDDDPSEGIDPEVYAHLESENAYCAAVLAHTTDLQERLFAEIKGRIEEDDESVPVKRGTWWYSERSEEGREYPSFVRWPDAGGHPDTAVAAAVLLDVNLLADGEDFCDVGTLAVSVDGTRLAYSVDHDGDETYRLHVRDLTTGNDLADEIWPVGAGGDFSADGSTLFYVVLDDTMRPYEVRRHTVGTPATADAIVFSDPDGRFFVDVERSRDDRWMLITAAAKTTTEVWLLDARTPDAAPFCVRPRVDGIEYVVECHGDTLFIVTNEDALDGRVCVATTDAPGEWREIVPHEPGRKLDGVEAFADFVVVWGRAAASTAAWIHPVDPANPAALGPATCLGGAAGDGAAVVTVRGDANPEFVTSTLRISEQSLASPPATIDLDVTTGERTVRKQEKVLGRWDPTEWVTTREWARSADGTDVPVTLVHRHDVPTDGTAAAVLYGYGAYEICTDPWFSWARLSLLERGMVFAVVHPRGGGELGRKWYDDGKLAHKAHTFADTVAAAEHLIRTGRTSASRLVVRGGSAGGLLVGATLNVRPDLFAGAVAEVPFVDVVNTMLDPSLPLTVTEYEEWGNPAEPEAYAAIRAYAPYENVAPAPYPRILATAGLHDVRVGYWEPAKWVAAVRDVTTSGHDVLFRCELGAGHGGPTGRYDAWRDEARVLAFILDTVGLGD